MLKSYFSIVTRNLLSLMGTAIATVAALIFCTLFAGQLMGLEGGPYLGILTYLIIPMFFVLGLVLIPIGIWWHRRQERKASARGESPKPDLPVIDLNNPEKRKVVAAFGIGSLVAAGILAIATYKGVETMESVEFCGQACHKVMEPEATAHARSPHARVACASCHIGAGADWFVKSKLSGSWQLVAVMFNLYPTPIPTPVHNLRPARETCEQCHWPAKNVGDRMQVRVHYDEDETNTEKHTVLLVKVGGQHGRGSSGIHWHVDPGVSIRYLTDDTREKIYDVEMKTADGKTRLFKGAEDAPKGAQWRTMDCVDCHNRPAHTFRQPAWEVDLAMEHGTIDRTLPFIKREGLRAVQVEYPSHEAARDGISADILSFYKKNYPQLAATRADDIRKAGKALGDIYSWNVFPQMKVTWGTYPNHLGHKQSPGCFRCHDKKHKTADGEKIKKDCDMCHTVLADDEKDPAILYQLNGQAPPAPTPAAAAPSGT